jgi:ring-1,2-phenylacetyl-CoA epoxidase subunit PaaC
MTSDRDLFDYVLRLGDSALVLGQRLSEWCGHGPALEEDIALSNVALDLIGQARLWLAYAAEIEHAGRDEDKLAFLRDCGEFRNMLLVEQPNGNYAHTMARQLYFDTWHYFLMRELSSSCDRRIAEIAEKVVKEVTYHVRRSADWVVRLGDGTELSHARTQHAIDDLWMYTGEMFEMDALDEAMLGRSVGVDLEKLRAPWLDHVRAVITEATLKVPEGTWMQKGGKRGVHSEHLGHLLSEMQFMQRAYPDMRW